MADVVKNIKIKVDGEQAIDQMQQIVDALQETNDALKQTNNNISEVSKKQDATVSSLNKIASGFKGIGLAIKAAGIGLVISAFNLLKEALMKNETVMKLVETAMNAIQLVINQVVDVVVKVYNKVSDMTNGFEHTKAVISDMLKIAFTPLQLAFDAIILAVNEIQLAWEKSIFGKGDIGRIKELQDNIAGVKLKLKDAASSGVSAFKDLGKNIGGAVKEIGTLVKTGYEEMSKAAKNFSLKATLAEADRIANAEKYYKKRIEQIKVEIKDLDTLAETYRQIRDTSKIFEEREQASKDLLDTLEKIKNKELELADTQYKLDILTLDAQKKREAADAKNAAYADANNKYAQQKSEQLTSQNALTKEQIDLQKELSKNENDRTLKELEARSQIINKNDEETAKKISNEQRIQALKDLGVEAEDKSYNDIILPNKTKDYAKTQQQIEQFHSWRDELREWDTEQTIMAKMKLERERNLAEETFKIQKKQLEDESNNIQISEAERILALDNIKTLEKDYNIKKIQFDENFRQIEKANRLDRLKSQMSDNDLLINDTRRTYNERLFIIEKQIKLSQEAETLSEQEKFDIYREYQQKRRVLEQERTSESIQQAADAINYISQIDSNATEVAINNQKRKFQEGKITSEQLEAITAEIYKKQAKREKAYAIASAIISTAQSIVNMLNVKPPTPLNFALATAAGILGVAQIAKIISTPLGGETGGGSGNLPSTTAGGQTTAPSTSFTFSQNKQGVSMPEPIKTYVLTKDVKNQQQLERRIVANGTV